ncbi:DUF3375 domain-containing protein [Cellulosimicrobium cellulans]|uniref:DUF3375 domain-containing protein n=1 Tax=Cellulosimicrobium cellulans TaxID=1710 RepID=UPI002406D393|nr:DUF3375 domain-containing protein [Cellulosimicrobium cellulans]MDF9876459.1 hypothetical protein [Cellulosimicrobium cellulans]
MTALRTALTMRRLAADGAWSLLRGDNAPVAIAVLGEHLGGQRRRMPAPELFEAVDADVTELRDHGFALPRTGTQYCRDWLASGYLVRRPGLAREELFELSESALTAIRFAEQLATPLASATQSRLTTIVERLHRLAVDTDPDTSRRIAALQAERDHLDARIAALASGREEPLAADRAVEGVVDVLAMTAEIPEDFARVRAALEQLNRDVRTQLVEEPTSRGAVLDDVFRGVDLLAESDAGRTFAAFYALVLDAERTAAFEADVEEVVGRDFARRLEPAQRDQLRRLLPALQDSGSEIHQVMTSFSRSLRRFVQSEELAEDRRVHRLLRETLASANRLADGVAPYRRLDLELDLTAVSISRLAGMRLHNPADSETAEPVTSADPPEADLVALRAAVRESEIDLAELTANVNDVLALRGPATIAEVLADRPATQGVASVVGLLVLAEQHGTRTGCEAIEHVTWVPPHSGAPRGARLPQYLFEEPLV